jgi:hypothetical protein
MNNQTKQARPQYTLEFKQDAANTSLKKTIPIGKQRLTWGFLKCNGTLG